jgi:hypothetical protein
MNDQQQANLYDVLGKAFDKAAVSCSHQRQAALLIVRELTAAGFKIEPAKTRRAA